MHYGHACSMSQQTRFLESISIVLEFGGGIQGPTSWGQDGQNDQLAGTRYGKSSASETGILGGG